MEEINQNPQVNSQKRRVRLVVLLLGLILALALSLLNFAQVLSLKTEMGEIKTNLEKLEPVAKMVETLQGFITPAPTVTKSEPIEVVGIIQYSDVEGGCWYIQPEFAECKGDKCPLGLPANYEPLNLPKELQKTGTKAKFKLEILPDVATTCQLGPAVRILDYQIVK